MCFVFAGGVSAYRQEGNLHFLPFESDFFHPDLVHAADLVVGKAGYSMIAEVWAAGVPFAMPCARAFGVLCLGCISAVTFPHEVIRTKDWLPVFGSTTCPVF